MPALQKILKGMVCSEKEARVSTKRTQETVRFDKRNRLTDKSWKKKNLSCQTQQMSKTPVQTGREKSKCPLRNPKNHHQEDRHQ